MWPALLVTGLLSACANPDWQQPPLELPQQWDAAASPGTHAAAGSDVAFWQGYGDAQLEQLLQMAMLQNNDLAAAAVRLRKAGLAVDQRGQDRLPNVTLGASSGSSWTVDPTRHASDNFSTSLGVSWEIDLWGRLADQQAAARWRQTASRAELDALQISIRSEVAIAYWTIARDQETVAQAEEELERARQLQQQVEQRYAAGVVSGLDRTQARANVIQQQNRLASTRLSLAKSRWALGILLNQRPESTSTVSAMLPAHFPTVPAGLPVELLDRRPDLAAATATLRAAFSDQQASRKSWYPTLSLTGTLGSNSTDLVNLLANPAASLGAGLALPFIQWNEMQTALKVNEADYELAVISYRQKLLGALQEVESALATRSQLLEQLPRSEQLYADNRKSEAQTLLRYQAGAASFESVLNAQTRRKAAELEWLQDRYQLALASVQVYKVLGGEPVNRLTD
ncbi:TolC family protein [Chitinilyticum piscinae]|uniref:TolC family protein n=1 Tax=Chitinilyticum piscinae TaxID=2866724 RepID=A0A8J7FZN2_9NEIS|nr:TolC family protein [Chitinilyticum piscinae]MBE9608648.1 TolC family protein [Chitinilyticum piscinae]